MSNNEQKQEELKSLIRSHRNRAFLLGINCILVSIQKVPNMPHEGFEILQRIVDDLLSDEELIQNCDSAQLLAMEIEVRAAKAIKPLLENENEDEKS